MIQTQRSQQQNDKTNQIYMNVNIPQQGKAGKNRNQNNSFAPKFFVQTQLVPAHSLISRTKGTQTKGTQWHSHRSSMDNNRLYIEFSWSV